MGWKKCLEGWLTEGSSVLAAVCLTPQLSQEVSDFGQHGCLTQMEYPGTCFLPTSCPSATDAENTQTQTRAHTLIDMYTQTHIHR